MQGLQRIEPISTVDQIVDQIIAVVRAGSTGVGDRLPSERELAELFGVSRSTLREAITTLSAMGVVKIRRGVGTFVSTTHVSGTLGAKLSQYLIADGSPVDALEVRTMMEPALAALAAERADDTQVALMATAIAESQDLVAQDELYLKQDRVFHTAISQAAGNRMAANALANSMELWFSGRTEAAIATMRVEGNLAKYHEQHVRVFEAIKDGDAQRAFISMEEHLAEILKDFRIVGLDH